MRKILSEEQLTLALHQTNKRKGCPVQLLCDPVGSVVPCKALRTTGSFCKHSVYIKSPHQLLKELEALPDAY
jgi:hypothetical protein